MLPISNLTIDNTNIDPKYRLPFRFAFVSYGVNVTVESNSQHAISKFRELLPTLFAGNFAECDSADPDHIFTYEWNEDQLDSLYENGEWVSILRPRNELLPILESRIRLTVAEFAESRVFVHAGVVAVNGNAIVLPGKSFSGKTTLVTELVRNGAEYYSDEYAVIDEYGMVHPFAKPLSIRKDGERKQTDTQVDSFGGIVGVKPVPIGLLIFTMFHSNAKWKPRNLNHAAALLGLIRDTIPIRREPERTIATLSRAIADAIVLSTKRNEAAKAASSILKYLDRIFASKNHSN